MTPMQRIQGLLDKKRISRSQFFELIAVNPSTAANWFAKDRIPSSRLPNIADALDTTVEYLIEGRNMNVSKLERALQGQTTLAKRIYNCVPKNQTWSSSQIASYYGRDFPPAKINVIDGCLYSLKDAGLIKEVMKGQWVKSPISNTTKTDDIEVKVEESVQEETPVQTTPVETNDPLALVGDITSRMKTLLEELDDAALAISEMMAQSDKKSEQLVQLKALLKNIAD